MSQISTTQLLPGSSYEESDKVSSGQAQQRSTKLSMSSPSRRTRDILSKSSAETGPFEIPRDQSNPRPLQIGVFPTPLTVDPLLDHRQTLILLHGRGGNAIEFGYNLLNTEFQIPSTNDISASHDQHPTDSNLADPPAMTRISQPAQPTLTLKEAFPHAKFVFPTAAPLRARLFRRKPIFQWFDNWALTQQDNHRNETHHDIYQQTSTRDDIQIPGLQASTEYIHSLLRTEIDIIGVDNVVLGGLSQGCACALISLLTWSGPQLSAMFGMCGWLPFAQALCAVINEGESEYQGDNEDEDDDDDDDDDDEGKYRTQNPHPDLDDLFERDSKPDTSQKVDAGPQTASQRMISELQALVGSPGNIPTVTTPIFLGHGTEDEKVPITHGQMAARTMAKILASDIATESSLDAGGQHARVRWRVYQDLGHWYSSEMLGDIVAFVQSNTNWGPVRSSNQQS